MLWQGLSSWICNNQGRSLSLVKTWQISVICKLRWGDVNINIKLTDQASCGSSLRDSGTSLHPPCSTSPSPRQSQLTPQPEELILEIKRLRDRSGPRDLNNGRKYQFYLTFRLRTLESENMRLSATINSTNRQVDIRLQEIEQRLEEDSSQEDFSIEEEEKNQESFI